MEEIFKNVQNDKLYIFIVPIDNLHIHIDILVRVNVYPAYFEDESTNDCVMAECKIRIWEETETTFKQTKKWFRLIAFTILAEDWKKAPEYHHSSQRFERVEIYVCSYGQWHWRHLYFAKCVFYLSILSHIQQYKIHNTHVVTARERSLHHSTTCASHCTKPTAIWSSCNASLHFPNVFSSFVMHLYSYMF